MKPLTVSHRAAGLDLTIVAPFPIGEPVAETFECIIAGCAAAGG